MRAMFLVALVLCSAANAQSADAPLITLDREGLKPEPCLAQPGDVVLKPEAAISAAKRLASAEAKVAVYEKHPPLPAWAVVIIAVAAAGAGAGLTVAIYEAAKPRP